MNPVRDGIANGVKPIFELDAKVVGQRKVAEECSILSLFAPPVAKVIQPGQFVQIRCALKDDPLLPRPFSIYRVREKKVLDILYEVVGRGTALMAQAKKGSRLTLFGPLGNTFSYPQKRNRSILVGGGAGLAPFYDLAEALIDPKRGKQKKEDVIVLLGARNRRKIFCEEEFKKLGVHFKIATDDGSRGFKGFVTGLLEEHLLSATDNIQNTKVYACGPTPMLRALSRLAEKYFLPCEVSLDAPMPCGYGICFGCAVKVQTKDQRPKTEDPEKEIKNHPIFYKLACIDGPIFNIRELVWE